MSTGKHGKNKLVSGLGVLLIVVCVLLIAGALTVNLLFRNSNAAPELFNYHLYLQTASDMAPTVSKNSAVFVEEAKNYVQGDIVLYDTAVGGRKIAKISLITPPTSDEEGTIVPAVYYITDESGTQNGEIDVSKLCGICRYENVTVGKMLLFMTSRLGIVFLLVLPCVLLLIYVISRFIAAGAKEEDDEDEEIEEPVGIKKMGQRKKPTKPLFSSDDLQKDPEHESRKATIAENFSKRQTEKRNEKNLDTEEGKRAMEAAAAERRMARFAEAKRLMEAKNAQEAAWKDDEPAVPTRDPDVEARAAAIKQAMQQRAQAQKQTEEPAAKPVRPAAAPQRPAAKPPVRRPAPKKPAPARPAAASFEDLMKKLDEEKKKLDS